MTELYEYSFAREALVLRALAISSCVAGEHLHGLPPNYMATEGAMKFLCDDLDTLCRLLAVRLGRLSEPWEVGSFVALRRYPNGDWDLIVITGDGGMGPWSEKTLDVPGLDAFTTQAQALDAIRHILTYSLENDNV